MKRLATLLLAAGLVFGATHAAQAVEFKGSGLIQEFFVWADADFEEDKSRSDKFRPAQRVRIKLEMIASENLRGVFQIEHDLQYGQGDDGNQFGGDRTNVAVKHAYLDWVIPSTDVQIRMGLQPVALPSMVSGSAILDEDFTGIVVSKAFNENVAATVFWLRVDNDEVSGNDFRAGNGNGTEPLDAVENEGDATDLFAITVPMTFDGFNITPWAMYGTSGVNANVIPFESDAWWVGLTAELLMFDPFRLAIDFNYGSVDADTGLRGRDDDGLFDDDLPGQSAEQVSTDGFYLGAIAEYKLDMMTPGLLLWYASGNDGDIADGNEVMPVIAAAWGGTSFGFDGYYGAGINADAIGTTPVGTWGVALQAIDMSFMEDLSHVARIAYYEGTNEVAAGYINAVATQVLLDDEHAWEVNFNTTYNIYENLVFVLELAYIDVDWNDNAKDDSAYRVAASFGYSF